MVPLPGEIKGPQFTVAEALQLQVGFGIDVTLLPISHRSMSPWARNDCCKASRVETFSKSFLARRTRSNAVGAWRRNHAIAGCSACSDSTLSSLLSCPAPLSGLKGILS